MFDWIPLPYYTAVFHAVLLALALVTVLHGYRQQEFTDPAKFFSKNAALFLLFFVIFYMGTRPVSGKFFGDMSAYAQFYKQIRAGKSPIINKEFIFNYFLVFCTKIMGARAFFFVCTLIYTLPCWVFAKKYGGRYGYFIFFFQVSSLMFWPFGVNGIRNGMASSIFILALAFLDRKFIAYLLMALAWGIHGSMAIPIAAYTVTLAVTNPKIFLYIWLAAIPLSLAGGSFWEHFFAGFDFGNDRRAADYLTKGNINHDTFAYTGFRWDFLLYSAFAVAAGWYFIFKKNITDRFYIQLWGIYTVANAFWILIIRANFSNRFAYLSWFLMGAVIAYPLSRYKVMRSQYAVVSCILFGYCMFTFLMFLRN